MAYAALLSLPEVLQEFLTTVDDEERKQETESLQSSFALLQKLLEEFPGNRSFMMKQLETRIADAAYQVEDILTCETIDLSTPSECLAPSPGQYLYTLGNCLWGNDYAAKLKKNLSLRGMFNDFGSCVKEVHSIVEDATEIRKVLDMKKNLFRVDSLASKSSPSDAPVDKDKSTLGENTDLTLIKERILGRNPALQVIPITGMGGIGKTSLAKTVYEDPQMVQRFDVRLWATVSQEYNAHKILEGMLSGIEKALKKDTRLSSSNNENDKEIPKDVASLIVLVHKKLLGRRYLIVMDDIWNVEAWDKVRNALPDSQNCSRIILTSRLVELAAKVDSSSQLHQMQLLNEDQSWALFLKQVFGKQTCPLPLEKTGKLIAKKCKGLPLAIVVIAGLLKHNHKKHYWKIYAKNITDATAPTPDDQLLEVLSLSYDNLPHLKACFLYMSMFPEDEEIPIQKLIRLWVAERFLKPKRDKIMEEAADEYLMDLVDRNLITVDKKRSNGRIKTCRIHDILRELSSRKAKEEKFLRYTVRKSTNEASTVNFYQYLMTKFTGKTYSYLRRVGMHTSAASSILWDAKSKPVRSLIVSCSLFVAPPSLIRFRLLRVLDVLQVAFSKYSDWLLCSLVYLRYLALTYICGLSGVYLKSINNLKKLETLIINHKQNSYESGLEIRFPVTQLPKLRHFVLITHSSETRTCYRIREQGVRLSYPNSLRTLSGVTDLLMTEGVIRILVNVLKLKMKYFDSRNYELVNLARLQHLEELSLQFYPSDGRVFSLPNIGFPDGLKMLTLNNTKISWEKMLDIGLLPNLEVLKLEWCYFGSSTWEPVEGQFMSLKYLKLQLPDLRHWRVESSHFPCLEQLVIGESYRLEEVPAEVGEIDTLRKLVIQGCSKSAQVSARKIQVEQQSLGNILEVLVMEEPNSDLLGQRGTDINQIHDLLRCMGIDCDSWSRDT